MYLSAMKLKDYREARAISQFTFAVEAGITPGTVANIERGNGCTSTTAQKIIAATGGQVSLDDLVPVKETNGEPEEPGQEPNGKGV